MPEGRVCHFRVGKRDASNAMLSRAASFLSRAHSSVIVLASNHHPVNRQVPLIDLQQNGRELLNPALMQRGGVELALDIPEVIQPLDRMIELGAFLLGE